MARDGDLGLTDTGELTIVDGDLVIVTGKDSLLSDLRARLEFFKGEWFRDLDEGVPFFTDVFVKKPNLPAIRTIFADMITSTPGIKELVSIALELDAATRTAVLTYSATSDLGELISETIEVSR
jgi:hypothetical protein